MDQLGEYAAARDRASGADQARQRIAESVTRVVQAASGLDVFDVVEALRLENALFDPEEYKETEDEGSLALIELVAVILSARGSRSPVGMAPEGDEQQSVREVLAEVTLAAREALRAGQFMALFEAVAEPEEDAFLAFSVRVREVGMRNLSYPHMVEETLSALFEDPSLEVACRRVMGCTVPEIRAVFKAMTELQAECWDRNQSVMLEIGEMAAEHQSTPLPTDVVARGRELLRGLVRQPSECSLLSTQELASRTGLPVNVVAGVVELFATPMLETDPLGAALAFLRGDSRFRLRPILLDGSGNFAAPHNALLTPAIQGRVEEALVGDKQAWEAYREKRGKLVEEAATELVSRHLPGCEEYLGLEYFVPTTDEVERNGSAAYTKLVEGDALLVVDDVAIVLEAKSGTLRGRSRAGDRLRLRGDLRRIVTGAAEQGERLRGRILEDKGLRLRDGSWLDLGKVREVHTIAVSLEDLSGIATVTSELVDAGLLSGESLPWTVSLHDLRIISEIVDRPSELLLYIRRRTEPNMTRHFVAVDEIDFFMHFYAGQLYVEADPDQVRTELPQLAAPTTRDYRKYKKQGRELLTSRTDPVDAWYMNRLGYRQTPAAKPKMNADVDLLALVDNLAERREPGWLAMSAQLLDVDTPTQRRWGRMARQLSDRTRGDGQLHSVATPGGTKRGNSFLLIWMTTPPGADVSFMQRQLEQYVIAKKHQLQVARALGILIDGATADLLTTVYDHRIPGPDAALDRLGAWLRLADSVAHPPPPSPKRRGTR